MKYFMSKIQIKKKTTMKYLVNGNCNVNKTNSQNHFLDGTVLYAQKKCNFCSPLFVKLKEKKLSSYLYMQ